MITKFLMGACIIMHGHVYKVEEIHPKNYLLEQIVTVFEEERTFHMFFKRDYVDKVSEKVWLTSGAKCRDN